MIYKAAPLTDVVVPLSDIYIQDSWNSRSGQIEVDTGDPDDYQFSQLLESIRNEGQKNAVDVRLSRSSDYPLELLTGYRRCKAILRLAPACPMVKVRIHDCSDSAARAINLAENIERSQVSNADLAWGLHQLQLASKAEGKRLTAAELSSMCGLEKSKGALLLFVMNKVDSDITKQWRESALPLPLDSMSAIARKDISAQPALYRKLCQDANARKAASQKRHGSHWLTNSVKFADLLGGALGRAERNRLITTDCLDFREHLGLLIRIDSNATAKETQMVAERLDCAYRHALEGKDDH